MVFTCWFFVYNIGVGGSILAHKTFISYKYSEARELRDKIIRALGSDAKYYNGEDGFSTDMSGYKAETIKRKLADMMYDTSVTIVILSPNMKFSNWIAWEIEYSLKKITRKGRTSRVNGVVAVIMKCNGDYSWFVNKTTNLHGNTCVTYNQEKITPIIAQNHFNSKPEIWHCSDCETYDSAKGSYIEYVYEDDFLRNANLYIENAFCKSENDANGYEINI